MGDFYKVTSRIFQAERLPLLSPGASRQQAVRDAMHMAVDQGVEVVHWVEVGGASVRAGLLMRVVWLAHLHPPYSHTNVHAVVYCIPCCTGMRSGTAFHTSTEQTCATCGSGAFEHNPWGNRGTVEHRVSTQNPAKRFQT